LAEELMLLKNDTREIKLSLKESRTFGEIVQVHYEKISPIS